MLKNCEKCNRVFAHPTRSMCEGCFEEELANFVAVKEYLKENPGASVAQVANETEVDVGIIYEYIRQGRLDIIPSDVKFHCEICGAEISFGRICPKCKGDLVKGFRSQPVSEPEPESKPRDRGSKVHYLDQIKDRR